MKIKTFEIEVKEKMNNHPIKTIYTGVCTEKDVINFFGLKEDDVEWFNIKEISNNNE